MLKFDLKKMVKHIYIVPGLGLALFSLFGWIFGWIKDSIGNYRYFRKLKENEKKYGFSQCYWWPKRPLYKAYLYGPEEKIGYVDENRRIVIPLIYKSGGEFENGVAIVSKDCMTYGAIDTQGNEVIAMIYSKLKNVEGTTLYIAEKNGCYGVLTNEGEEIMPFEYCDIRQVGGYLIAGVHNVDPDSYCYGVFSEEGNLVLPVIYYDISYAAEDCFWVKEAVSCKRGLINTSGKWLIPAEYDDVGVYWREEQLCTVSKDMKWGCVDIDNNIVIPFLYDKVSLVWKMGNVVFALCRLNGKYGFIEVHGGYTTVHIPFKNKNWEKVHKKAKALMKSRGLY